MDGNVFGLKCPACGTEEYISVRTPVYLTLEDRGETFIMDPAAEMPDFNDETYDHGALCVNPACDYEQDADLAFGEMRDAYMTAHPDVYEFMYG